MDKYPLLIIVALILVSIGFIVVVCATPEDVRTISTSGSGAVTVTPDMCRVSLSITNTGTDVQTIQNLNTKAANRVISALQEKYSLSEEEIRSSGYSISEVYREKFDTDNQVYQVSHSIAIETEKILYIGDMIDTAIDNGATGASSLSFYLSPVKEHEYRDQALSAAVAEARGDAEIVAAALGSGLGAVQSVNVQQSSYPLYTSYKTPVPQVAGYDTDESTSFLPGETEVNAYISMVYAIN